MKSEEVGSGALIAIVDYGRGNLFSIARALEHVGAVPVIAERPEALKAATAVILPGVGAFRDAMAELTKRGFDEALRELEGQGVPLLGICLGMQLLFDQSEEFGTCSGLGLIPGDVRRLPPYRPGAGGMRVPNVGWRRLVPQAECPLLSGTGEGAMFYFVHSYVPVPARDEDIAGTLAINGMDAAVMVQRGSVFGCQFHPEKSGPKGLALLEAFVSFASRASERQQVA